MGVSSLFERVAGALFGGRAGSADDPAERQLVADVVELVVETVEPRIRFHASYQARLQACVRETVAYLRGLRRQSMLEPVLLARAAWASDPRVNAFFATAADVQECLGRSRELRTFLADPSNREVQEAYALLGMKKEERKVLGTELEGETLKREVAQIAVSFSGHRLVAPAATLDATYREIGWRIIQRLAQVALSGVVALAEKATELEQRKASLGMRIRMLNLARNGLEGLVRDPATIAEEIKVLEREMTDTVKGYTEAKGSLATLDGYIKHVDDVFSHCAEHVSLTRTPLRVSRMGIKVDNSFTGPANELSLAELSIGADLHAAIAIVRCPRSEMPPKEDLIAKAERYL